MKFSTNSFMLVHHNPIFQYTNNITSPIQLSSLLCFILLCCTDRLNIYIYLYRWVKSNFIYKFFSEDSGISLSNLLGWGSFLDQASMFITNYKQSELVNIAHITSTEGSKIKSSSKISVSIFIETAATIVLSLCEAFDINLS